MGSTLVAQAESKEEILEVLRNQVSLKQKDVNKIVQTLPETLERTYTEILKNSPDPFLTRNLLQVVLASARPLSLDEINVAMARPLHG